MSPRPLEGRTVVVTRAREQAADLADGLAALGAEVLAFPTIRIAEPESWGPADDAAGRLGDYDWVLFTSANAVEAFLGRLDELGLGDALRGPRIAAVGPATAARLASRGLVPDVIPDEHVAEGLLDALEAEGVGPGARVLLPRAARARDVLPDSLRERGALVDVAPVYRTVTGAGDEAVSRRLREGTVDVVTFTSSSTVSNFLKLAGEPVGERPAFLTASIGPVTSETLRSSGLPVDIEAASSTVPALVGAIADRYGQA